MIFLTETRTKWWLNTEDLNYNDYFFSENPELEKQKIKPGEIADNNYYSEESVPVFFGHYWLRGEPNLQKNNVVCLDYSTAKGGELIAYRCNGEKELSKENFVRHI